MSHKTISWLTGILTLLLALFSFILSFNALTDLAQQHGVSIPPLFPFIVEFAVVIFSLNALYRSLNGETAKLQWTLIIGSSILAGIFNIAHATPDILSRAMAAMPSLFLLLSFESFLNLVKYNVTRQGMSQSLNDLSIKLDILTGQLGTKQIEWESLNTDIDELSGHILDAQRTLALLKKDIKKVDKCPNVPSIETLNTDNLDIANGTRVENVSIRRDKVFELLSQGMSKQDIATELDVSPKTVQRDITALNGRVSS